ncbi:MAG: hypothetical protein M3501_08235 [Actinomycetota bacterium]|nr:hypothetical protein [Actinomycetota bacterium]
MSPVPVRAGGTMVLSVEKRRLDAPDEDVEWWLSRPIVDRLAAVEVLRRRAYGIDDAVGSRLQRVCQSFARHEVRYLIVGGYALAAHGLPRATGGLDTWVWVNQSNAERIVAALEEFGFGGLGLTVSDFEETGRVVQLGYPPHRIDILTSIDGVEFDEAWERRITVSIDNSSLPIIGRDDLVANKVAVGRAQDLADIARLRGDG